MPQILAKKVTEYKHDYVVVPENDTIENIATAVNWPGGAYTVYDLDEMGPGGVLKSDLEEYKLSEEYVAEAVQTQFPSGEM
jgi:hypothetical protein